MSNARQLTRQRMQRQDGDKLSLVEAGTAIYDQRAPVQIVHISSFIADPQFQMRDHLDERHVEDIMATLDDNGQVDEPVVLFKISDAEQHGLSSEARYLVDGFHRHQAHLRAKRSEIKAIVRRGTYAEAIVFAEECNLRHGARLNRNEIFHILSSRIARGYQITLPTGATIYYWQLSDGALASDFGVDRKTISNWIEQLATGENSPVGDRSVVYSRDGSSTNVMAIRQANQQRAEQRKEYAAQEADKLSYRALKNICDGLDPDRKGADWAKAADAVISRRRHEFGRKVDGLLTSMGMASTDKLASYEGLRQQALDDGAYDPDDPDTAVAMWEAAHRILATRADWPQGDGSENTLALTSIDDVPDAAWEMLTTLNDSPLATIAEDEFDQTVLAVMFRHRWVEKVYQEGTDWVGVKMTAAGAQALVGRQRLADADREMIERWIAARATAVENGDYDPRNKLDHFWEQAFHEAVRRYGENEVEAMEIRALKALDENRETAATWGSGRRRVNRAENDDTFAGSDGSQQAPPPSRPTSVGPSGEQINDEAKIEAIYRLDRLALGIADRMREVLGPLHFTGFRMLHEYAPEKPSGKPEIINENELGQRFATLETARQLVAQCLDMLREHELRLIFMYETGLPYDHPSVEEYSHDDIVATWQDWVEWFKQRRIKLGRDAW